MLRLQIGYLGSTSVTSISRVRTLVNGAFRRITEFLRVHGFTKVKSIDLDTIRTLASMVLKDNVFVYGKHIYKQIIGGAMGSSFTLTLANIFMWKWQKELVRQQDITGEFYGRYVDHLSIR